MTGLDRWRLVVACAWLTFVPTLFVVSFATQSITRGLGWASALTLLNVIFMVAATHERRAPRLPQPLVVAIANLPRLEGRPVFFYRTRGACHNLWDRTIERAGLKRLTPHSGRHGFATTILRNGIDPKTGAWLGGWKNIRHFMETYAHAIEDITLNERIFGTPLTQTVSRASKKPRKTGTS